MALASAMRERNVSIFTRNRHADRAARSRSLDRGLLEAIEMAGGLARKIDGPRRSAASREVVRSSRRTPTRASRRAIVRPTPEGRETHRLRGASHAARLDDRHENAHAGQKSTVIGHWIFHDLES